jgi:hypothetical protein
MIRLIENLMKTKASKLRWAEVPRGRLGGTNDWYLARQIKSLSFRVITKLDFTVDQIAWGHLHNQNLSTRCAYNHTVMIQF